MKIQVIGSAIKATVIQGVIKIKSQVVLTHQGKVKKGIIIRTKSYNQFKVSYDEPAVVILGEMNRIKGPISKGLNEEIRTFSQIQY